MEAPRPVRCHLTSGPPTHSYWNIEVAPGCLTCWTADGTVFVFTDPNQLQIYADALCAILGSHAAPSPPPPEGAPG
jgi:hypothetical protein